MRNILIAFFILFEIILVTSQEHEIKGTYHTVSVPPNLDAWAFCSPTLTDFISFSVRIAYPNAQVEAFGDIYAYEGNMQTPYTGAVGSGFYIQTRSVDQYTVPSLGCGKFGGQVSYECDVDMTGYIEPPLRQWCLFVINPFTNPQKAKVAVSFTTSVFKVPFDTPDTPNFVVGGDNSNGTLSVVAETDYNYHAKTPPSQRKRNFKRNALRA